MAAICLSVYCYFDNIFGQVVRINSLSDVFGMPVIEASTCITATKQKQVTKMQGKRDTPDMRSQ